MKVISTAFDHYGMIPQKYTCDGDDVCPPLAISHPPIRTKSFAILMHDHDAESEDFVHWLMWNIAPDIRIISEGAAPVGATAGANDFGRVGWGGPCPPSGRHHYEFHVYALDTILDLPAASTKESFRDAISGHVLEETSIIGLYETL